VIEGRGYDSDGRVTFNAFGTISYDAATRAFTLHSYAMGRVGDFVLKPAPDGYTFEATAYTSDGKICGHGAGCMAGVKFLTPCNVKSDLYNLAAPYKGK